MICAYSSCDTQPIIRLKLKTGWALFCRKHYDAQAQQEADAYCAKNGLDTTEKKIAFCKEKMGLFMRKAIREPGQDDEEKAA
jgi:hypothetical protein